MELWHSIVFVCAIYKHCKWGQQPMLHHISRHLYPPQAAGIFGRQALRSGPCTASGVEADHFARKQSVGTERVPSQDQAAVAFCCRNTLAKITAATLKAACSKASARRNFQTPQEFREDDRALHNSNALGCSAAPQETWSKE